MDNTLLNMGYLISITVLMIIIIGIFYYLFYNKKSVNSEKFEVRHQNKVENYKTQIQTLESQVNNIIEKNPLTDQIPNVDKERELFELYYKGIPDTYDLRDNLIRGVEPDAIKAIDYLQFIINSAYGTEQDTMRLARIYHYGMHMFDRNLDKAEEIYNRLKFDNVSIETSGSIKEALNDIQKIRVYTWLNLPLERPTINPDFAPREVNILDEIINRPRAPGPRILGRVAYNVNLQNYPRQQVEIVDNANNDITVDRKDYNDTQNTHNPQVLSTIRLSLEKLKNIPIIKNQGVSVTEIRTYINALEESDKKQDALRSLRVIESNPDKLSSTDMTEMDALTLVWNRINDKTKFNKEISDNLKETMFDELASMQEFGATICSTGRFTHIVDTLNGVDEEVSIKPTYVIREEMLLSASNIREKLYQEETSQEKELLERGTSSKQEEFEINLKKTIVTKLKEDYVDTGILPESKFTFEINKWINEI
jgi:hypothetical protein